MNWHTRRAEVVEPYGMDRVTTPFPLLKGDVWRVVGPYEIARQFTFSRPTERCCNSHRAPTGWQHLPRISKGSKLLPALERAGERHLVDKFQMPAYRDAVRQAGDLDPKRLQQP